MRHWRACLVFLIMSCSQYLFASEDSIGRNLDKVISELGREGADISMSEGSRIFLKRIFEDLQDNLCGDRYKDHVGRIRTLVELFRKRRSTIQDAKLIDNLSIAVAQYHANLEVSSDCVLESILYSAVYSIRYWLYERGSH